MHDDDDDDDDDDEICTPTPCVTKTSSSDGIMMINRAEKIRDVRRDAR